LCFAFCLVLLGGKDKSKCKRQIAKGKLMANPAIVYPFSGGTATLSFSRPPRRVPAYSSVAVRHDNVASSGVHESVLERIDNYLDLDLEWVGIGCDVQAWAQFMNSALQGGVFTYYPDSVQPGFSNYWLEDTNWTATYKCPGQYSFKLRFRQVVT
jgi:hypothetical protein